MMLQEGGVKIWRPRQVRALCSDRDKPTSLMYLLVPSRSTLGP